MGSLMMEKEKEKGKEEALKRHARLHKLYTEDRLAFERERKRAINELLDSVQDDELRSKMNALQESWDTMMKKAGSGENRLIVAQTMFSTYCYEIWGPLMQKLNSAFNAEKQ